ncbi:hypothetical protein J7L09_01660 [bacterium]|nr:hypothetical protein [bacterium]
MFKKYKLRLKLAELKDERKKWLENIFIGPKGKIFGIKESELTKKLEWFDKKYREITKQIEADNRWSLVGLWNKELTLGREEPLEPRDYIWASEIGKNYWERYMRMNAVPYTNPYTERILRKFEAGKFFERLIGYILTISGILKYDNKPFEIPETEKHLRILGKVDFIAGGKPNWDKIRQELETNLLFQIFPTFEEMVKRLVEYLSERYPAGLKTLIYEIKSINSQLFWSKKEYLQQAYLHHQLQLYTYLRHFNIPEGRLLYISKDDLTLEEFPVYLDSQKLKELWEKDVETMTYYIRQKKEPPKPERIVFDPSKKLRFKWNNKEYEIQGKWVDNWEIEWSVYRDLITGPDFAKWKMENKKLIAEKNQKLKEEFIKKLKA